MRPRRCRAPLVVVLAVAAGMLVGCGGPDRAFQDALSTRNISLGATAEDARGIALGICAGHDANTAVDQIVGQVASVTGLGPQDTGYVIGAATAAYCEQHLPRLRSSG